MDGDSRAPRSARVTVTRFLSAAEADRHDLEFWMQMSGAERLLHAWRLSQEIWSLSGGHAYEPGLCRSVARVQRR